MDDPIWNVSTFSKNRQRFLDGEISEQFFNVSSAEISGELRGVVAFVGSKCDAFSSAQSVDHDQRYERAALEDRWSIRACRYYGAFP